MQLAVLGCGMMGTAAVYDLTQNRSVTKIIAADIDIEKAVELKNRFGDDRISPVAIDVNEIDDVKKKLTGSKAVLGAIHYKHNYNLSRMAIDIGAHFCDLGGNIWVVDEQMSLDKEAKRAGVSIIPDCGLAPGMVAVVVAHGVRRFDSLKDIHIRVGGLPQNPKPPLDYALVFSVEGLVNEYVEPARVIRNGELIEIPSLTEVEELSFPAPFEKLEAFITSGGTSTLVGTYLGKIENLDYKTIRYPGHCNRVKTLSDLGFFSSDPSR
jgi:lysine 6-dehydrogenase